MSQAYLRDRVAGTTVLITQGTTPGTVGNNTTSRAMISENGRFVTLSSYATNLEPGDTNGKQDIFRWDRLTNSMIQISEAGNGSGTDDDSFDPSISRDGERIAFSTGATNIDADDDNGFSDMYVWDAVDGETDRVSEDIGNADGNGPSNAGTISADGRYVVFSSTANDLVFNDSNGLRDTFRVEIDTGFTSLVSKATTGSADGLSSSGVPSADGRFVAFASSADNLVPGGSPDNGTYHVFVCDMTAGTTLWVSRDRTGGPTNDFAFSPGSISADGRLITFTSAASDLVAGDTNGVTDAFIWDRSTGRTRLLVLDRNSRLVNGSIYEPRLSADGRWLAFYAEAGDLVPEDTDTVSDVFVWRMP